MKKGSRGKRKLTEEEVIQLRQLYIPYKVPVRQLAPKFGIGVSAARRYLNPTYYTQRREWRTINRVSTTVKGKRGSHKVEKRPKPQACEVCGKQDTRLNWHHWNDEHLEWGLWLCNYCHIGADFIDKRLDTYLQLRSQVEDNGHQYDPL